MEIRLLVWLVSGVLRAVLCENVRDPTLVPSATNHNTTAAHVGGDTNLTINAENKSALISNTMKDGQHSTPRSSNEMPLVNEPTKERTNSISHADHVHNMSLTTFNVTSCLSHGMVSDIAIVNHTSGYIIAHSSHRRQHCKVIIQVSPTALVGLKIQTCTGYNIQVSQRSSRGLYSVIYWQCNQPLATSHIYSDYNIVELSISSDSAFGWGSTSSLFLHFYAVKCNEINDLELVYLTPFTGYVQTSGWDTCIQYVAGTFGKVRLTPPAGQVTFLTVPMDNYEQMAIAARHKRTVKTIFFTSLKVPAIFKALLCPEDFFPDKHTEGIPIIVKYLSEPRYFMHHGYVFFRARLRFSFHSNNFKPKRVASRRSHSQQQAAWNCSMLSKSQVDLHFPCDLVPQCVDFEDEVQCPYISEKCGFQQVHIGGKCYIFDHDVSFCRKYNGTSFMSLETYKEWTDVTTSLKQAGVAYTMWLRLLPAVSHGMWNYKLNYLMYGNLAKWTSGSVAWYLDKQFEKAQFSHGCLLSILQCPRPDYFLYNVWISVKYPSGVQCELPSSSDGQGIGKFVTLSVLPSFTPWPAPLVKCPLKHLTHLILACDSSSRCRSLDNELEWYNNYCNISVGPLLQYFYCGASGEFISYTLVCDACADCAEGNDENFCVYSSNTNNAQKWCDGQEDNDRYRQHQEGYYQPIRPPALIDFDGLGGLMVTPLSDNTTHCPDTHFQCPDDDYCLPVYVRCNDVIDCPGHEDEAGCENFTCPGFYRCRGRIQTVCVHLHHLHDGQPQCPHHDDELVNEMYCPRSCTCYDQAFICNHTFHANSFLQLRYLDASGSGLNQADIVNNTMLIYLNVQACGWTNVTQLTLPNLHSLDIGDNLLEHVYFSCFVHMIHLRIMRLAGNPISGLTSGMPLPSLVVLNLSRIWMHAIELNVLSPVSPHLEVLDLSLGRIQFLQGDNVFFNLRVLDLRGNSVSDFSSNFMKGMHHLTTVSASNFKICCSAVLPASFKGKCTAPHDEISSCDDLLKSGIYQLAVLVFSMFGILGNMCSLTFRVCCSLERMKTGFSVFVLHLSFSDCLMGVYLAFIAMADRIYGGVYVWKERDWKTSPVCSVAGFLAFLSCEVSAFIIFLITLDRFVVLHFPFSHTRFTAASAHVVCGTIWVLGFILAIIPLLPMTSHWEYYRQTGICIPLPVTRAEFAGHTYSFSVMIFCNLILFVLIAVGQTLIFWSVRSTSMSVQSKPTKSTNSKTTKSNESIIARRLFSIAMSDFLCWFPIGLCGMLASAEVPIAGEVNVALAVLVLPLNSALNPFIYTLNIILEKRQRLRKQSFQ